MAERVLDWSGLPTTHLRPTFFAEWLLYFASQIAATDCLALPFGEGRHAPIAAADQARVIAALLEDPGPHAGATYELYGPREMTHAEIAAALSRALGCPIRYESLPLENLEQTMQRERGLSPFLAQHVASVAVDYQQGVFEGTNDVVERLGGRPPLAVEAFIAQHRAAFLQPPAAS